MSYNAKGQKKYNTNSTYLSVKYAPQEQVEGQRVKAYLEQFGQSANSYIKSLIKADLDRKGFFIADTEQNANSNNNDDTADI